MSLGFKGLLAADIHLDLLGLCFGPLGESDFSTRLLIMGAHLRGIDRIGQGERASKAAVVPLDAAEILFLLPLVRVGPAWGFASMIFYPVQPGTAMGFATHISMRGTESRKGPHVITSGQKQRNSIQAGSHRY